jgi:hypothetical protein
LSTHRRLESQGACSSSRAFECDAYVRSKTLARNHHCDLCSPRARQHASCLSRAKCHVQKRWGDLHSPGIACPPVFNDPEALLSVVANNCDRVVNVLLTVSAGAAPSKVVENATCNSTCRAKHFTGMTKQGDSSEENSQLKKIKLYARCSCACTT